MIFLAGMNTSMPRQVATGREAMLARRTDVLLLGRRLGLSGRRLEVQ